MEHEIQREASHHGVASLLSGVGGLDLALEQAGVNINVDCMPSTALRYRLHHQRGPQWPWSTDVAEPKGPFLKWLLDELRILSQSEVQ